MVALDDSTKKIHLECGTLEENDHHCASQPCINGRCYGGIDDFFCICSPNWKGKTCNDQGNRLKKCI